MIGVRIFRHYCLFIYSARTNILAFLIAVIAAKIPFLYVHRAPIYTFDCNVEFPVFLFDFLSSLKYNTSQQWNIKSGQILEREKMEKCRILAQITVVLDFQVL